MSAVQFVTERTFIIELLHMYKQHPCLWDHTHLEYNNKEARRRANDVMLVKYKTLYEDATMETLRKRIEHMRAAVRRERKKVLSSMQRGEQPRYTPRLWYFKHMAFLETQFRNDFIRFTDHSTDCEDHEEDTSREQKRFADIDPGNPQINEELLDRSQEPEVELCDSEEDEPKPKKPTIVCISNERTKQEDTVSHVTTSRPQASTSNAEESEAYGRAIGLQLKQLDGFQRTVAQKIISDAIFYGRLNKLSANSYINLNADKYN